MRRMCWSVFFLIIVKRSGVRPGVRFLSINKKSQETYSSVELDIYQVSIQQMHTPNKTNSPDHSDDSHRLGYRSSPTFCTIPNISQSPFCALHSTTRRKKTYRPKRSDFTVQRIQLFLILVFQRLVCRTVHPRPPR